MNTTQFLFNSKFYSLSVIILFYKNLDEFLNFIVFLAIYF